MGILDDIIKELKTDDKLQQIMELCTRITEEEAPHIKHPGKLPDGPNTFLSIEIPPQKRNQINYLTLEREDEDTWLIILYSIFEKHEYELEPANAKRVKTFEIKDHRPKKILTEFAKKVKFFRGE